MKRIVTAITGASGAIYGFRLIKAMAEAGTEIHLIISGAARFVIEEELQLTQKTFKANLETFCRQNPKTTLEYHEAGDFTAAPASGSKPMDAMVVCPCTMATLGAISSGAGTNLIHRAADVTLKEKRPLILVPREMPLSLIHLQNITQVAQAGATILPASPSFYSRPGSIAALADTVVARILDHLGITPMRELTPRWKTSHDSGN